MKLEDQAKEWTGTTLPQLIQQQVILYDKPFLQKALDSALQSFDKNFSPALDKYSLSYPNKWFVPEIKATPLSEIFLSAADEIRHFLQHNDQTDDDDAVFEVFNIFVMRMSVLAHGNEFVRKQMGIRNGAFG